MTKIETVRNKYKNCRKILNIDENNTHMTKNFSQNSLAIFANRMYYIYIAFDMGDFSKWKN